MGSCSSQALAGLRTGATMLTTRSSPITSISIITFPRLLLHLQRREKRNFSIKSYSLDPPDVNRLAETARISLTSQEVEEFAPKIQQVVQWFGQLQAVDLESIEPAVRSDIDGDNMREDMPQTFENQEAIIAAIPSYEESYIKVPKVLNKE